MISPKELQRIAEKARIDGIMKKAFTHPEEQFVIDLEKQMTQAAKDGKASIKLSLDGFTPNILAYLRYYNLRYVEDKTGPTEDSHSIEILWGYCL